MLMLKDVPQYECLLERSKRFPELDPSAVEAFLHLLRTSSDVFEAIGSFLEKYRISPGRFTVLMLLTRNPDKPINLAELAEAAGVTRATMTGLIDILERDGFVKRRPDAADRRVLLVAFTAKGRSFLGKIVPAYYRRVSGLMKHTTAADRRTLVQMMAKVQRGVPAFGS
ncbi:MAG: hypothetical protein A3G75_05200 [Verrucomicrobia bacterium RIFCSPLOWO2_12_FULL_64_8]|nr:MAG: hypothetical protein A3G75_05200 [Verrucomicrobia bacterium RIFCSPLOWO2_12_FULL_64_8]